MDSIYGLQDSTGQDGMWHLSGLHEALSQYQKRVGPDYMYSLSVHNSLLFFFSVG